MTDIDIDAIRRRADAATDGPWTGANYRMALAGLATSTGNHAADAEFIAHARTDVPALLAEVERLRAELTQANEQRDRAVGAWIRNIPANGHNAEVDRRQAVVDAAEQVIAAGRLDWDTHPDLDIEAIQGQAFIALADAGEALGGEKPVEQPSSTEPRFTVAYALDTMTDIPRLRVLAKQYFAAMLTQHQFAGHLIEGGCEACNKARETYDPDDACDQYKQWQRQYENAVGAL
jgi:hypothetical protein